MPAAIGLTIIAEVTLIPFGHGPLHDHRIIRDEETGDGRLDTLKVFLGFNAEPAHKTYCRQAEQGGQDAISPSFDSARTVAPFRRWFGPEERAERPHRPTKVKFQIVRPAHRQQLAHQEIRFFLRAGVHVPCDRGYTAQAS